MRLIFAALSLCHQYSFRRMTMSHGVRHWFQPRRTDYTYKLLIPFWTVAGSLGRWRMTLASCDRLFVQYSAYRYTVVANEKLPRRPFEHGGHGTELLVLSSIHFYRFLCFFFLLNPWHKGQTSVCKSDAASGPPGCSRSRSQSSTCNVIHVQLQSKRAPEKVSTPHFDLKLQRTTVGLH